MTTMQLGCDVVDVRSAHQHLFRFRVQSFVDSPDHARALPVGRGRVPLARVDRASVRTALERAADYAVRQLRWDGSFEYIYQPFVHQHGFPHRTLFLGRQVDLEPRALVFDARGDGGRAQVDGAGKGVGVAGDDEEGDRRPP